MTVAELIKELQKMDPLLEVSGRCGDEDYGYITDIYRDGSEVILETY